MSEKKKLSSNIYPNNNCTKYYQAGKKKILFIVAENKITSVHRPARETPINYFSHFSQKREQGEDPTKKKPGNVFIVQRQNVLRPSTLRMGTEARDRNIKSPPSCTCS